MMVANSNSHQFQSQHNPIESTTQHETFIIHSMGSLDSSLDRVLLCSSDQVFRYCPEANIGVIRARHQKEKQW